ncbi:hypothetical protein L1987_18799 [Smallanthus sonchifolius]|uniref:Uncharacterized protein n=1 Tax=Smallanthus sonchifolius TaxID=185202 RepID=A0ACB9J127_9ASTR|nr:hypothetical protein L1987_18799 [Smallanthus sonchifolius]
MSRIWQSAQEALGTRLDMSTTYHTQIERSSNIQDSLHVSNLKKCLSDETLIIPSDENHLDDKLHFIEEPIEVTDWKVQKTRRGRVKLVRVRWNSKRGPEYTWGRENKMKAKYPSLFTNTQSQDDKN